MDFHWWRTKYGQRHPDSNQWKKMLIYQKHYHCRIMINWPPRDIWWFELWPQPPIQLLSSHIPEYYNHTDLPGIYDGLSHGTRQWPSYQSLPHLNITIILTSPGYMMVWAVAPASDPAINLSNTWILQSYWPPRDIWWFEPWHPPVTQLSISPTPEYYNHTDLPGIYDGLSCGPSSWSSY